MREATQTQRRTRGAVLAAALLFAAPAVAEPAAALPQGESCPAEVAASSDVNTEAAELMRRLAAEDLQPGQNPSGDSDTIVLNNRGYNYGPGPGLRFDPVVERPPADPHAQ